MELLLVIDIKKTIMIVINYIKPNIVVYSDFLFSGTLEVRSLEGDVLLRKKVVDTTLENILFKVDRRVEVCVATEEETITKILNN